LTQSAQLQPRRQPVQKRARERTRQIFDTTARLLEEVGIDDLTTILIARELGISVGSLYHYFPNKHAILHGLGAQWLDEMTRALEDIEQFDFGNLSVRNFVDVAIDRMLLVYQNQRAILPLTQAFRAIPELRDLDEKHDEMVITRLVSMFRRMSFSGNRATLERTAWVYLEMTHAVFLLAMEQKTKDAKRTIADIKRMAYELLSTHVPAE